MSPTSSPISPRSIRPSAGGSKIRAQVPLGFTPVTMPSKVSPIRLSSRQAAADFRVSRSTFWASSSFFVQWSASALS